MKQHGSPTPNDQFPYFNCSVGAWPSVPNCVSRKQRRAVWWYGWEISTDTNMGIYSRCVIHNHRLMYIVSNDHLLRMRSLLSVILGFSRRCLLYDCLHGHRLRLVARIRIELFYTKLADLDRISSNDHSIDCLYTDIGRVVYHITMLLVYLLKKLVVVVREP